MSDELAKAIHEATVAAIKRASEVKPLREWDPAQEIILRSYAERALNEAMPGIQARAALDFLGITPEQAERMEPGAVGKAVEVCCRWYRNSRFWGEERGDECREMLSEILRALGVEVDDG